MPLDGDRTREGHLNRQKFVADSAATFAVGSSFLPLNFSDASSTKGTVGLGRTLTLDAKPASITFDTGKTAIVVVDMDAPGSPNRRVHEQIMHVGTTVRAPDAFRPAASTRAVGATAR
jgi:hypothetical protein